MQIRQGLMRASNMEVTASEKLDETTLYADLLEVMPVPAAYVGLDGRIILQNSQLLDLCETAADPGPYQYLTDMMTTDGWGRVQVALSTSLSGVPIHSNGTLEFRCGTVLCRKILCTSFVSFANNQPAVLIQFEQDIADEREKPDNLKAVKASLARLEAQGSLPNGVALKHFPDEV